MQEIFIGATRESFSTFPFCQTPSSSTIDDVASLIKEICVRTLQVVANKKFISMNEKVKRKKGYVPEKKLFDTRRNNRKIKDLGDLQIIGLDKRILYFTPSLVRETYLGRDVEEDSFREGEKVHCVSISRLWRDGLHDMKISLS